MSETQQGGPVHNYHDDVNGAQTLKTGDGPDQLFAWDLRGRMASATVNNVTTLHGYDTARSCANVPNALPNLCKAAPERVAMCPKQPADAPFHIGTHSRPHQVGNRD